MMDRYRTPRRGLAALLVCSVFPWIFAAGPVAAAELVPHRALYTASLRDPGAGGAIVDIGGSLAITVEKSCDGWLMGQQMALDITVSAGVLHQEIRFTSWESPDGTAFRFAKREKIGNRDTGLKGAAKLTAPGGGGLIRFEFPEPKTLPLPKGTLFPLGHMRSLIASAEAGENMNTSIVFDGTTGEGAQRITTFIGPQREVSGNLADKFGSLMARPAWPMRLATFPLDARAAEPTFEAEVFQLDNGVVGAMGLDMEDVKLDLKLERLEALPAPKC